MSDSTPSVYVPAVTSRRPSADASDGRSSQEQQFETAHELPPKYRLPSAASALARLERSRNLPSQRLTDSMRDAP